MGIGNIYSNRAARAARMYEEREPPDYGYVECPHCRGSGLNPEEDRWYGPHHQRECYQGPDACGVCKGEACGIPSDEADRYHEDHDGGPDDETGSFDRYREEAPHADEYVDDDLPF